MKSDGITFYSCARLVISFTMILYFSESELKIQYFGGRDFKAFSMCATQKCFTASSCAYEILLIKTNSGIRRPTYELGSSWIKCARQVKRWEKVKYDLMLHIFTFFFQWCWMSVYNLYFTWHFENGSVCIDMDFNAKKINWITNIFFYRVWCYDIT